MVQRNAKALRRHLRDDATRGRCQGGRSTSPKGPSGWLPTPSQSRNLNPYLRQRSGHLHRCHAGQGGTHAHVGDVGSSALLKLAVNTLLSVQQEALSEILSMAKLGGVALVAVANVIVGTPVFRLLAKIATRSVAETNFASLSPIKLIAKDLGYVLVTAGGEGMPGMIQLYISDGACRRPSSIKRTDQTR